MSKSCVMLHCSTVICGCFANIIVEIHMKRYITAVIVTKVSHKRVILETICKHTLMRNHINVTSVTKPNKTSDTSHRGETISM